jgi:hypothetical protein
MPASRLGSPGGSDNRMISLLQAKNLASIGYASSNGSQMSAPFGRVDLALKIMAGE